MRLHTYRVRGVDGVKDCTGDQIFPRKPSAGSQIIFIDLFPKKGWPHRVKYFWIENNDAYIEDVRYHEWPPDLSCFQPTTLDKLFSQIALLGVMLDMSTRGDEPPAESVESCFASLKDFRKKYNSWKAF